MQNISIIPDQPIIYISNNLSTYYKPNNFPVKDS